MKDPVLKKSSTVFVPNQKVIHLHIALRCDRNNLCGGSVGCVYANMCVCVCVYVCVCACVCVLCVQMPDLI